MTERKQLLKGIRLFLLYTFSISWLFWLIIIIANRVLMHFGMENHYLDTFADWFSWTSYWSLHDK